MPKVSVIIPTYNRCNVLERAIQSLLNQTFQDFELFIVDDHSSDDTHKVVAAIDDARIKYIRHESNKGAAAARNTGIRNTSCEYIAFLDDDDEWLPEKLGLQLALLESSPPEVGGVYTGYESVDSFSGKILHISRPVHTGNIYNALLVNNCIGSPSTILLKRVCFDVAGCFDENVPPFEDYDLWIRIAKYFQFYCIPSPLYRYYLNNVKISNNTEALDKGLSVMLKKYEASLIKSRRFYSKYYLKLGILYCFDSNLKNGWKSYIKAIRLYPFEVRNYYNLFISFLGPKIFKFLKEIKPKFSQRLRRLRFRSPHRPLSAT